VAMTLGFIGFSAVCIIGGSAIRVAQIKTMPKMIAVMENSPRILEALKNAPKGLRIRF